MFVDIVSGFAKYFKLIVPKKLPIESRFTIIYYFNTNLHKIQETVINEAGKGRNLCKTLDFYFSCDII
jgi:hypothetical protein